MPIKFNQSFLQADADTRRWMRVLHKFLSARPESAFHRAELERIWPEVEIGVGQRDRFLEALTALTALGAVESKEIQGATFYIFNREADPSAWQALEESVA